MRIISFVYVVFENRRRYRAKIGKANIPALRVAGIAKSIREEAGRDADVRIFIALPTLFPFTVERGLQAFADRLYKKDNGATGSGKTEYYWFLNYLCFVFGYLICYALGFGSGNALILPLVLLLFPRPLDFALLRVLCFVIEFCAVVGVAGLCVYALLKIF